MYVLAFLMLILFVMTVPADAADIQLVVDGKSEYTIIVSSEASPSEKHAAEELRHFLLEISGAEIPIAEEGDKSLSRLIVVGQGKVTEWLKVPIDFDDLGEEGFAIKTIGPHLVIAGGRLRGTMYGVYTFLEEVLGCRWYTSKASYIPRRPTITLQTLDIVQKPDFEYREPFYTDAWDPDWAARNKTNSNHSRLDEKRGGKVEYGKFVHTFNELVPLDRFWADHPEYYSLIDGKRTRERTQLCMSNPEVLRIATRTVLRWIERMPTAKIFSVSQNDWYRNCQCDACKAIDEEEGSPSGLMLRFVNAVAEEVEKSHPNVLIDTLAYQWTEKPPKITKPRHNVRVRLCPIFACEMHEYEKCPNNAGFVSNLQEWNKVTDNLYIWHYNTDFAAYLLPFPDLDQLVTTIPLYKRTGVKGLFMQGTYNAGSGPAGFMDELKAYLIAKLLWNTDADPKVIREDFLSGYYGKAGRPIGEFLDLLLNKVKEENLHGGIYIGVEAPWLTNEIIAEGDRLFDEAEKLAGSPGLLQRVKHARLSLEYVKTLQGINHAAGNGTAEDKAAILQRLEDFVKACEANGITQLNEGMPIRTRMEQLAAPLKQ